MIAGTDVPARRSPRRSAVAAVGHHAVACFVAVVFLTPVVFVVLTSLMTDRQTLSGRLWPHPFQWSNFATVVRTLPIWRLTQNTVEVAVLSTVGALASSVPVAYALARMRWRGRKTALLLILGTYMLPVQVTIVPLYVVFAKLHWVGSLTPLIVPSFFGDAFSIFLLRQFFLTIPGDLTDMACLEGASDLQILRRVILPLAKPAIVAVALLNFFFAWNEVFLPLLYVGDSSQNWTLPLALSAFRTSHHVQWNLTMAASVLFMLPVLAVFVVAQRALIAGIAVAGRTR